MKRLICILLLLTAVCVGCTPKDTPDTASPISDFEYGILDGYAYIGKYVGDDEEVIIPAYIEGLPVNLIAQGAFYNAKIKKVTIPETVTRICAYAFMGSDITEVAFSVGLRRIEYEAFKDCEQLKQVILPQGIVEIGAAAFSSCSALTEVFIPNSLKRTRSSMFGQNSALKVITFEEGLEAIGSYGEEFMGCTALEEITVPKSVKSLGGRCFAGCTALTRAEFMGDAPAEDKGAFVWGSDRLKIYYQKGTVGWDNACWQEYTLVEK